ncbi:hypothetical protein GGS24DRAFT_487861 [Hypoxylon argillaceum]|nr:hypothetical protein GGS24DRAFT_487861 [Hypoxylon argillaceum]
MRAVGWNVQVECTDIYQAVGSELVTFRDIPDDVDSNSNNNNHDKWAGIAFALTGWSSRPARAESPTSPLRPKEQNVIQYHIVFHAHCDLSSYSPLNIHLQASPGADSPRENSSGEVNNHEFNNMLAPASMEISVGEARRVITDFRSGCLNRAACCTVSGKGETWCLGPAPWLRTGGNDGPVDQSPRRLQEAWHNTWRPNNGILLMKHLHEFFDARLFSIHPRTLRVRAFVPYDVLTEFNGRKASIPTTVDRKALRHHYEMCCIENMAAQRPNLNVALPSISRIGTSVIGSPFSARTNLSATPSSGDTQIGASNGKTGRAVQHQSIEEETVMCQDRRGRKWRRLNDDSVGQTPPEDHGGYKNVQGGCITVWNSRKFLADVNWELRKFKAQQIL